MKKAQLIEHNTYVDDRGTFQNIPLTLPEVDFTAKRVYICENFQKGTVRGFHYHAKECKVFICLRGAVKFVVFPKAQTDHSICDDTPEIFVLTPSVNDALYIPKEYANAWQSLTDDTILLGISNVTVEESVNDDKRYDPKIVKSLWEVKWR